MRTMFAVFAGAWALGVGLLAGGPRVDAATPPEEAKKPAVDEGVSQGALRIERPDGSIVECPLKHTDVDAKIAGFIGRVKVVQTFSNPLDEKIEAVYVFPLPHKAAVDSMTMVIGDRRIVGVIQRREAAREIYEQALAQGRTAALLEQERPNIFTQSVGNIGPKQEVRVEISYVDVLDYDMGTYAFHFPMVVGPRFIPGSPNAQPPALPPELQGRTSDVVPPTDRVPDAHRITPPALKPGERNGHDISLAVSLDSGVPVRDLKVVNHKAGVSQPGPGRADVKMDPADSIPNKDFELRYKVVGEKPAMAVLSHTDAAGVGAFLLMIQPREDDKLAKAPPREIYFVCDVSGSMSGQPTDQVKRTMRELLKLCKPEDTVQVVTFASQANELFPQAVPLTDENIGKAVNFTDGFQGGGGTMMLEGVKKVLNAPPDPRRVRIAIMLTDGFIGNEAEIIAEVGRRCGDRIRFWCIGIGSSVNRFLVDGVAKQGGGMGKVLSLTENPAPLAQEVMERIHRAQLADIRIDWGKAPVYDTYPAKIPELWAGRPVILLGRYEAGAKTTLKISGKAEGEAVEWPLEVDFPVTQPANDVLVKVWARHKIEDLMQQTYYEGSPEVKEAVTRIALDHSLMSQYTSFVAVDESQKASVLTARAQPPRRMLVPVPIPEGTRYEGFFGGGSANEFGEEKTDMKPHPDGSTRGWHAPYAGRPGLTVALPQPPAPPAPVAKSEPAKRIAAPMRVDKVVARRTALTYKSQAGYGGGAGGSGGPQNAAQAPAAAVPFSGTTGRYRDPTGGKPSSVIGARAAAESLGPADWAETAPAEHDGAAAARQALEKQAGALAERAAKLAAQAESARKEQKLSEARALFVFAYLADTATARFLGAESVSAQCLAAIDEIDAALRTNWVKQVPALAKRLDVVLRDVSAAEAAAAVAAAAGVDVPPADGSAADAAAALSRRAARVTWLDLRGAKTAQALDWLLRPLRMEWRVQQDAAGKPGLVAGAARRLPGKSAWVYDVAAISVPSASELKGQKDAAKTASAAADEFMSAVVKAVGLEKDDAAWFAPGQILVFADAAGHDKAATLFAALADEAAAAPGVAAELKKRTAARAAERKGRTEVALAAQERAAALGAMREFSPRLLAEASAGAVDDEALTELRIAWRAPEARAATNATARAILLRSAFAVAESARAVPKNDWLAALAADSTAAAKAAAAAAVAAAKAGPKAADAVLDALIAALLYRDDAAFKASALPVLVPVKDDDALCAAVRTLAGALLNAPADIDGKALAQFAASGAAQGDDLVTLTALACRRAGGEAWTAFRAARSDLLGHQPLSGAVVVLVNRLDRGPLALASAK